ncbi:PREDICTED: serine hydrolase-like protein 2 [Galeopterus variegatus]|uniref:Serine hydrolase-like protein 2 n=1 Tax=Galeopterus variegatus TaxID=482537 RepID=A0ABM0RYQ6_GALVR|nr:PREDICTED: serine hydrolase-like protein 2 [Galeopterus variegatus]
MTGGALGSIVGTVTQKEDAEAGEAELVSPFGIVAENRATSPKMGSEGWLRTPGAVLTHPGGETSPGWKGPEVPREARGTLTMTGGSEATIFVLIPPGVVLTETRDRWPEHSFDLVGRELCTHPIRKLQARVLLIKCLDPAPSSCPDRRGKLQARVLLIKCLDPAPSSCPNRRSPPGSKSTEGRGACASQAHLAMGGECHLLWPHLTMRPALLQWFQFVAVSGNHYTHMNEPHKVATITNSFLQSKHGIPAQLELWAWGFSNLVLTRFTSPHLDSSSHAPQQGQVWRAWAPVVLKTSTVGRVRGKGARS